MKELYADGGFFQYMVVFVINLGKKEIMGLINV